MFDAVTSALIASAPALEGLDPRDLREELTAAYVEIAAARLSLGQVVEAFSPELTQRLERMGRLADAYEARIVLDLDSDRRRSIAFVAASARQFMALASRLRRPEAIMTRLDEDTVGPEIAAALLFLIAERSPDAFEAARDIHAAGEPDAIRRALILAINRLARGRLQEIVDLDLRAERSGRANLSATPLIFCSENCCLASSCWRKTAWGWLRETGSLRPSLSSSAYDGFPWTPTMTEAPRTQRA